MPDPTPPLPQGFLATPFAHRGLHRPGGPVENSLTAINAAALAGYGIEIDVQPAADGTPMVFHDGRLDRMTRSTGRIRSHSVEKLMATPLGGTADRIPTLDSVLSVVSGRAPLLIEIKDQDGRMGPGVGPLEERVADCLKSYDGPVALMSFNPHSVAACKAVAPHLPRGMITCAFKKLHWPKLSKERRRALAGFEGLGTLGVSFVSHDHNHLDSAAVRLMREIGMPIICWTVKKQDHEQTARRFADQITFEAYTPALSSH